jgi:cytochrome c oxidase assembly protein subunit 11
MTEQGSTPKQNHTRFAIKLGLIAVSMFVFAVGVMPPLYDVICEITGLNGKTSNEAVSAETAVVQEDRVITVQFLAKADPGMPWDFKPNVRSIKIHPGEIKLVDYHVRNRESVAIVGQAIPSVSPASATAYFKKTECFCFTQQALEGGASMDMPLIFYVDPDLPKNVSTITLSYTLFNITDRVAQDPAALATAQ